jgi:cyanate lyase
MSRLDVTEKIVATKVAKGLKWSDVAAKVGLSKEWVTAACLGQMTLTAEQAGVVAEIFGLTPEEKKWLMVVPYKGSLPTSVPTDPLIYRFYELVSVYGTTFKELIHEEFGRRAIGCRSRCRASSFPTRPTKPDTLSRAVLVLLVGTGTSVTCRSTRRARSGTVLARACHPQLLEFV